MARARRVHAAMLLSNPPSLHPRRPLMACAPHGGTRIHPRHHLPGIMGLLLLLYGVLCRAPEHPSSTTTSPATPGYDAVPIGGATRTGRGAGCGLGGWRCSLGHVHYSDMCSSNFRFSAASSLALLVHTSATYPLVQARWTLGVPAHSLPIRLRKALHQGSCTRVPLPRLARGRT